VSLPLALMTSDSLQLRTESESLWDRMSGRDDAFVQNTARDSSRLRLKYVEGGKWKVAVLQCDAGKHFSVNMGNSDDSNLHK